MFGYKTFKSYVDENEYNTTCLPVDAFINKMQKYINNSDMNVNNGLINLAVVFSAENIKSLLSEYEGTPINNINDLVTNYSNWIVKNEDASSSMLQGANVNGSVDYETVELLNPENDLQTVSIAFVGCKNPFVLRTLPTEKMVILFTSDDNGFMSYQFINSNYTIIEGSFTFNGVSYNFTVDAELLSTGGYIYIESDNNKYCFDDEFYADTTDKNDVKRDIEELLNNAFNTKDLKANNFKMQYVCIPNN